MRTVRTRPLLLAMIVLLAGSFLLAGLPTVPVAAQDAPIRVAGAERIGTSIAISQEAWGDGTARAVVLARHDNYPDALAGAPLASAADGPLLLTTPQGLWPDTGYEILRVLPAGSPVVLLGGVAALSEDVARDLADMGYDVYRADGASRYDTSVLVARAAHDQPQAIFLADGNSFASALIAGAAAGATDSTVVLSNGADLPNVVADYLDTHPTTLWVAVGPAASVALPNADVHIVGQDVYEDSRLLAEYVWNTGTTGVAVASGENWPDGLAGAAHAAVYDIPLLLSPWAGTEATVYGYLQNQAPLGFAYIYGGTAALSDQVYTDLFNAM